MSRWFRHYAGMMRDDKLVSAAIRSKQPIERVVWVWGAILESASEIDDGGLYRLDCAEVAYFLRADETDIRAVVDALADAGRVAADHVVKWGDRQFQSDRSADRQARYRDRKRGEARHGDDQPPSGDDVVTGQSRHGDAPETDTEEDTETERDKPRPSVVDPGARDFEELLEVFPRNPRCPEERAEAAWRATKAKDRTLILVAARRHALAFAEECEERQRTPEAGKRYEPFLATWIESGAWKHPIVLKADANKPDASLVVFRAGDPVLKALEVRRGKPFVIGDSGTVTVRKADVEALSELVH